MSRQKTKEVPFSNTATQIEAGVWQWECGGTVWQWRDGVGLNTGPVREDGSWRGELYFKNIREAGCFAEGFCAGSRDGTRPSAPSEAGGGPTPAEGPRDAS